jgi:phage shock protein A
VRIFHRITHTVSAGIESLLDQVENQEAVAWASIEEIEQGAARVRGHRKRSERRIQDLEARLVALEAESKLWKERAVRFGSDRDKALECVRRHLGAEQGRAPHTLELAQQRALRDKIVLDERAIETKLSELRARCAALSSREARCVAQTGVSGGDIERVFDRWEARLDGTEGIADTESTLDHFAQKLSADEEQTRVEEELDRILAANEQVAS